MSRLSPRQSSRKSGDLSRLLPGIFLVLLSAFFLAATMPKNKAELINGNNHHKTLLHFLVI